MRHDPTPLVPAHHGLGDGFVRACLTAAVRTTLLVSPRPTVLLVRRAFAAGGAAVARGLEAHTPGDVAETLDERYGESDDELLDLYRPASSSGALPTLVWVHGGGWVGGSKDELAGYFKLIASHGFTVVGPRYSLAPERRYPTPPRQVMEALRFLQANAERLELDATSIVVGGDSAGAQIAAQVAALVTTPGYSDAVGVVPAIAPDRLRGVVLACGPYDLSLLGTSRLVQAVGWAYSGHRRYRDDPVFSTLSVADHVTAAFPPALVTVGNADPLRPHSERLVERLRSQGSEPETLFFPDDYTPALGHEYQFDLDTAAGRLFLDRMITFLRRVARPESR